MRTLLAIAAVVAVGGIATAAMIAREPTEAPRTPPPRTTWTSGPLLKKVGTNVWKLQGVAHWEGDASHANQFLEQDVTVVYVLKERGEDGALRVFDSGVLYAVEVFPCAAVGGTGLLEANDLHDLALNLKGAVAGEISVYGRLTLGTLSYRTPDGRLGDRIATGTHSADFRYHYQQGNVLMRAHPKEPGFAFDPVSRPTYYEYSIPWDESSAIGRKGHAPDRLPAGGVRQR